MNKKAGWTVLLALIVLGWLDFGSKISATAPEFSVKAILTENQRDASVSYFDLLLEEGATEELQVEITNSSGRELTVELQATTAVTNINGLIDYNIAAEEPDNSLEINIEEYISIKENQVTIPKGETKSLTATLNLPKDKGFNGILLGGLTVSEKKEAESTIDEGNQITNRFVYSIAVMVAQNDEAIQPELNLKSAAVEQRNRRNFIVATIQNSASTIVNHFDVEATVYKKGRNEPIFHEEKLDMRMAPNSSLPFGISTNNQPLTGGTYEVHVKATNGDEEWEWVEIFTITNKEAKEMNDNAVELEKDYSHIYLIMAGIIILLLFIVIVLLIKNKKTKKNTIKKKKQK